MTLKENNDSNLSDKIADFPGPDDFTPSGADPEPMYAGDDDGDFLSGDSESLPEDGPVIPTVPPGMLMARLDAEGKTSLTAVWQPAAGADGYDVFLAPSGTGFSDPYTTVSGEETSVTFGHLEKKTAYKTQISAFILSRGQKTYVAASLPLHSITGGGTKKTTNAREIVLKDTRLVLPAGKKKRIAAEAVGQDTGKKVFAPGGALRYLSGSPEVAAVTEDGKVRGLCPGSCRIWLVALNGVHAVLDVSVVSGDGALSFRKKKYSLKAGETINLKKELKAGPETDLSSLKWKSSDKKTAEVSKNGLVTARKKGKAAVRVKTAGGDRAKVRIRVTADPERTGIPWESAGSAGNISAGNH